jgi:prolyl-tRNA synthetase
VRWEATETKPFFRTKEFLWQEGHTAHENGAEAWAETLTRLDQYAELYEDVLALPALRGAKPEHDKFPGADTTTTVETLMPDGKSVQAATSHYLGTSFGEAFDIAYTDEDEEENVCHTTSWGLSWRALGALIMTHSDDQGLVLPPAVAPDQVAVVPIWHADDRDEVLGYAERLAEDLREAGVRVELDDRDERNPGFKFNEWELKGVPLRLEVGPLEVEQETATAVHRPDGESLEVPGDRIVEAVRDHLDRVHDKLYEAAAENLEENVREAGSRGEILGTIGQHGGYVAAPWCGDEACEEPIKSEIAAEIVAVPLDTPADEDAPGRRVHEVDGEDCALCGEPATTTAYFARTY